MKRVLSNGRRKDSFGWSAPTLLLFDKDHRNIVSTRHVACVLPGFECPRTPLRRAMPVTRLSWASLDRLASPAQQFLQRVILLGNTNLTDQTSTVRHLLQLVTLVLPPVLLLSSAGLIGPVQAVTADVAVCLPYVVRSVETPCRADASDFTSVSDESVPLGFIVSLTLLVRASCLGSRFLCGLQSRKSRHISRT
jgi:hypothetical protein